MPPLGKRQRRTPSKWYCGSGDEFLYHDRLRLGISSSSSTGSGSVDDEPAWHHWFKRKPRTLRQRRCCSGNGKIVPESEPVSVPKIMSTDVEGDIELGEFEIGLERILGREVVEDLFFMEGLMQQDKQVKLDYESRWKGRDARDATDDNKRTIMLNLNYTQVMSAWSTQGSPWTDGERPANLDVDLDDTADYSASSGVTTTAVAVSGDGSREARVSRYKEKRRRRLFSKKIRYQVRKLNAEKRPRMKGRFVKRTPPFTHADTSIQR